MKKTYMIYPFKFIVSLVTFLFSTILAVTLFSISRLPSAVVFTVIAILFLAVAILYGSKITLDDTGLTCTFLLINRRHVDWNEIAEVGIVGSKVFRNDDRKDVGTLYLYFSPVTLTEQERFELVLHWPPFDKLFLKYSPNRLEAIQQYWSGNIVFYHAGDVFLSH